LHRIDVLTAGLGALWLGFAALVYIVLREIGWDRLKHRMGALSLVVLSVAALPGAAFLKIVWPYEIRIQNRILAHIIRVKSEPIVWSNGCTMFPPNNAWNTRVFSLPLDPNSARWLESMQPERKLHGDFSMPYAVLSGDQPLTEVEIDASGESDPGPYRIPDNAPTEAEPDAHALVIDEDRCRLYELYAAHKLGSQHWHAVSGAIFDLRSNALRPETWTSSDGAGLPVLPGLVRYDEVKSGHISHALRFTTPHTQRAYIWPARHYASRDTNPALPPMGARFRLRNSFDLSGFSPDAQVILTALKEYGMIVSDNGGPWFITGVTDSRWTSTTLRDLAKVPGAEFEAVDVSKLMIDKDSAEARQ
jgi:hypothetical protein